MSMITPVAARLATLRRRRALSQIALARLSGVSESTIKVIELPNAPQPQLRTVRLLSAALGVDPAEVLEFRRTIGVDDDDEDE